MPLVYERQGPGSELGELGLTGRRRPISTNDRTQQQTVNQPFDDSVKRWCAINQYWLDGIRLSMLIASLSSSQI